MERLFWIIQVSPVYLPMSLYRKEASRSQRSRCDNENRGLSETAMSQGMQAPLGAGKDKILLECLQMECSYSDILILAHIRPISVFLSSEVQDNKFVFFKPPNLW